MSATRFEDKAASGRKSASTDSCESAAADSEMEANTVRDIAPDSSKISGLGLCYFPSLIACLLGITVIAGWLVGHQTLIQIHASFVPMQFNTALGFAFSGASLIFLCKSRLKIAVALGLFVFFIGSMTGSQYLFSTDLGIDELLMDHSITVETSHPGRMAPNTALCFALFGAGIASRLFLSDPEKRQNADRLFGLALVTLGSVALLGYILQLETAYGWSNLTRMAAHTAVGFIVLGLGLIGHSRTVSSGSIAQKSPFWWSGMTFVVCALIAVALFQHLRTSEARIARLIAAEGARAVAIQLKDQLVSTQTALHHMALLWELGDGTPLSEWRTDAGIYIDELPVLSEVYWISRDYHVVHRSGTFQSDSLDIQLILERARNKDWQVTLPLAGQIELFEQQGQETIILSIPTRVENTVDGILVGIVDARQLLNLLPDIKSQEDYFIAIENGEEILSLSGSNTSSHKRVGYREKFKLSALELAIFVAPNARLQAQVPNISQYTLPIGGILSFICAFAVHIAIRDGRNTIRLQQINSELQESDNQQRLLNEELQKSNRQLDEFAYITSHDLKEPLRAISNHCRYLLEDYSERIDEDGIARLQRLIHLCQRLDRLMSDLLHYSRLGKQHQAIRPTDLNDVVADVKDTTQDILTDENAEILLPQQLPVVSCDTERVTEVFRNLITNGIKYNDNHHKKIEIGWSQDPVETFYVKDNGIGIGEEFHDQIFRIFKRLHGPKKYGGGTGSGLTFVKKIVEEHGGEVWLTSAPGAGTTFFFTLRSNPE